MSAKERLGLFNRRLLAIAGLSPDMADIIMEEVERGWKDTKRLEWIARHRSVSTTEPPLHVSPDSLREAIDRAMAEPTGGAR